MNESSSESAPLIRSERLWLTTFSMSDAGPVFEYASVPEVSRYTTWFPHTSIRDAEEFLRYALSERYCWAIRLYADGPVVGAVECTSEGQGERSVHYVLSPQHWGRGLMTEAVDAVIEWAFTADLGLEWIKTTVIPENGASIRVLEKCGMELLGEVSEEWGKFSDPVQLAVYGLSRATWDRHSS